MHYDVPENAQLLRFNFNNNCSLHLAARLIELNVCFTPIIPISNSYQSFI